MNLEYEFDILWLSDNKLRRNEGINGVDVFLCYLYFKFIWNNIFKIFVIGKFLIYWEVNKLRLFVI